VNVLGKFNKDERRHLFYEGITDNRGNIRLDRFKDAQEIIKRKEEKIRQGYNQLFLAKNASSLLGIKINECHIIAVFGFDVYIKCFNEIKQINYEAVVDYIKNVKYIERV